MSLYRRALEFVWPFRWSLAGVITLATILSISSVIEPLLMKRLFDTLAAGRGLQPFFLALGVLVVLELARAGMSGWLSVLNWDLRIAIEFGIRDRMVGKLNTLPIAYHQKATVGATMTRVNQGIAGFVTGFAEFAFNVVPTGFYLVLATLAMWRLDWRLALLVIGFTPIPALIGAWASREQTIRERRLVERWTTIYSRFNEVLAGMLTVKGFAMEDQERERFINGVRGGNRVVRRGIRRDTLSGGLRTFAATAARLAALGLGGWLLVQGEASLGTLVAFLGYIGGFFGPVQNLVTTYQTARKAEVSLEVIYAILDAEDPVRDRPGATDLGALRGAVSLDHVSFSYGDAPVLRDITLDVKPGETIALVGPSGSGKSTLLLLLQRLYHPGSGVIRVDGQDIAGVTQRSLRSQLGVVFQEAHLFNDTVRANIAYGRPDATRAEVEAAARAANAHDFITQLPAGYETILRERGNRLSGGQRQRLAIARALVKDPPILILDEATSALDVEAERQVQDALKTLLKGRTAFVVAHRLSTVVDADRIVVLDRGRIVEVGTHATLLAAGGLYASLVQRQVRGMLAA